MSHKKKGQMLTSLSVKSLHADQQSAPIMFSSSGLSTWTEARAPRRNHEESKLQSSFFEWLELQYPKVYKVTFCVPNGGNRTVTYASRLIREGLKSGVPDVFMAYPSNGWPGLFIEFKSKTGKLSPEQKEMIPLFREQGYRVEVIEGDIERAIKVVKEYLGKNSYEQRMVVRPPDVGYADCFLRTDGKLSRIKNSDDFVINFGDSENDGPKAA